MSGGSDWSGPTGILVGIAFGFSAWAQTNSWLATNKARSSSIRVGVGEINTVCYLFSLSGYLTVMAGCWLYWSRQLSVNGEPVSDFGKLAFLFAGESIGFQRELALVAVIMSIVIVPQLLNYIVAGLFGAAGGTKFGAWCLRVVFWSTLKGYAIAGGVSVGWGVMAAILNWPRAYESDPALTIGTGIGQISIAVLGTTMAGPLENSSLAKLRAKLKRAVGPLMPIHKWMTRYKTSSIDLSRY